MPRRVSPNVRSQTIQPVGQPRGEVSWILCPTSGGHPDPLLRLSRGSDSYQADPGGRLSAGWISAATCVLRLGGAFRAASSARLALPRQLSCRQQRRSISPAIPAGGTTARTTNTSGLDRKLFCAEMAAPCDDICPQGHGEVYHRATAVRARRSRAAERPLVSPRQPGPSWV
jgi:hypothetical protein